jgi:hypothetical protein
MKPKGKVVLITGSTRGMGKEFKGTTVLGDGGMTGYHPIGFIDLIAEMMKKKRS